MIDAGAVLLASVFCLEGDPLEGAAIAPDLAARNERYATVEIRFDTKTLPPADARLVKTLVAACDVTDEIFWRQNTADGVDWRDRVLRSSASERADLLLALRLNAGRFDLLDEKRAAFLGPGEKPPGGGYYPPDLTKEEIQAYFAKYPSERAALEGPNSVVRREGDRLVAVPYHAAYPEHLERLARLLEAAAGTSGYPALREYLRQRAADLRADDYYESDKRWVDLRGVPFDMVVGPYETYGDGLLGVKAAFEAVLMRIDEKESRSLAVYESHIAALDAYMPTPPELKPAVAGRSTPIEVVDTIYRGGDAVPGYQFVAFNLPNDPRVHAEKGSKKVLHKNFLEKRVDVTILPVAQRLLDPVVAGLVSHQAYFDDTLFHEIAHGLGTRIVLGTDRAVNAALGENYSAIEEAKADACGLVSAEYFFEKGVLPESERDAHYASFVGGCLRSVRFHDEAHAIAARMHVNRLLKEGALTFDEGARRFGVDLARVAPVMRAQALDLLTIQAKGDAARAKEFVEGLGAMTPPIRAAVEAVKHVPIDFRPVYVIE